MDNDAGRRLRRQGGDVQVLGVVVLQLATLVLACPSVPAQGAGPPTGVRTEVVEALEVLHGWDARRARAWAQSDTSTLRSLYAPRCAAARSDVRLLRTYTARGFVVRRMVTQVFGVTVIRRKQGRLTIRVLDRIAGGQVEHAPRHVTLPSTRPAVRRIEFRLIAGVWKVASVTR